MRDAGYQRMLRTAVAAEVDAALAAEVVGSHRPLMDRIKLFVAAYVWPESAHAGQAALIDAAVAHLRALRSLQGPGGLFIGGDNVDSPPDSAFTINDVCDALRIAEGVPALSGIAAGLDEIADAAEPALLQGGVHTPNHRWEISAALARLHRRRPSEALRARAEQWLAEGIDITPDGVYSERSANYAAYVSNPSLTVIAEVLGRADARAAVLRNLESTLGMIHPDATVETVHSRRQDQGDTRFPLAPYATLYRQYAVETGRGDFAWAAQEAVRDGIRHPSTALADLLIDPRSAEELPEAVAPASRGGGWMQSGLAIDSTDSRRLVVYGGSDYPRFHRVRSGLANNPTFLRLFAGSAVLDSVRLSRDFFGLGPFRAETITRTERGWRLVETVSANYYQPFAPDQVSAAGEYALSDDGRFYGSMDFATRERDVVTMRTTIDVEATEDGAVLTLDVDGPDSPWTLELAFRDGGVLEGVQPQPDGTALLVEGAGRYVVDGSVISFAADAEYRAAGAGGYRTGEDYAFLGATDAASGARVHLTGRAPGRLVLRLRAAGAEA